MTYKKTTALILILLTLPLISSAKVVINEVAWMGTEESYSDEWIELYNNSTNTVNLEGWKIFTADKKIEIILTGEVKPKGFFLLERTNDETVPAIKADLIYKGSLNNKGESLFLENKKGLIDFVDCSSGWFKGDNDTKATMERIDPGKEALPGNWQTSSKRGGTPKEKNSQKIVTKKKEENQNKQLAQIAKPSQNQSFLRILSIGLFISFFSGILILLLREKLDNNA